MFIYCEYKSYCCETNHVTYAMNKSLYFAAAHINWDIRGPFAKFVDSPYYYESKLCGGAVTVSFSKYFPWKAMHFLQRSAYFSKTCDHFEISCLRAPFSWLEKPRNRIGRDLN
jgi:hypothetical protein